MNSIRRGSAEATSEIWENRNSASLYRFHANDEPVPGKFRQEAALKIHPLSHVGRIKVERTTLRMEIRRIYVCIHAVIHAHIDSRLRTRR